MSNPNVLPSTPSDNNYTNPKAVFDQLTLNNAVDLVLNSTNTTNVSTPRLVLPGWGQCQLQGQVSISGTPAANMALGTLPPNYFAQKNYTFPVVILRSGAFVANAISISKGSSSIVGGVVSGATSGQTSPPTLTVNGDGSGATMSAFLGGTSSNISSFGSNYAPGDTITLAGGTFTSPLVLRVSETQLRSTAPLTAGSNYAPGNGITLAGGVSNPKPIVQVATTKLVSLTVTGGSAYAVSDTITLAGGTFGTAAVLLVTAVSSGAITGFTIQNAGSYTVNSATLTQGSTSGSGTGATFTVASFGVLTVTVVSGGNVQTNAATLTQFSTDGSGTGATFNSNVYGVATYSTVSPGTYSVIPSSPVSQGSTSGSGTGATFSPFWRVVSVVSVNPGKGYTPENTTVTLTPNVATVTPLFSQKVSTVTLLTSPTSGDVVCLDSPSFLLEAYS